MLDQDTENQDALSALERIYRQRGDSVLLAEILIKRSQVEPDTRKKREVLAEAAKLYEGPLADEFKAIEAWKKILEIDEVTREPWKPWLICSSGLAVLKSWWPSCACRSVTPAAWPLKAQKLGRIGQIQAEELDRQPDAIATYRELLDMQANSLWRCRR